MKPAGRNWLLAAAFIPHDAPLTQRIEILGKYLTPNPSKLAEIDAAQMRDQGPVAKDPGKLFGLIRVSPPKGQCFTITTAKAKRDVEVCKPTSIPWQLEDLDFEKSSFTWTIRTSPNDYGTPVTWKTPYTIAKIMPIGVDFYKYNSTPVFFKSCVPTKATTEGMPRKITLTQFNNKKWLIRFPDTDTILAPPTPTPESDPTSDPKKKAEGEGHGEKKAEGEGHGDKKTEGEGEGEGPGEKKAENAPKPKEPVAEPEQWTMNTGRAFEMSVGNLVTEGSMPPGNKGTCRYVYDYYPGDTSLGRIECHHANELLYFYAFLRCMAPIIPK